MSKPILVSLAALFLLSPPVSAQQQPSAPAPFDDPTAQAPARPDPGMTCDGAAMQETMQAMHGTGGPDMHGMSGGMHGMEGEHGHAMQGRQGPGMRGMQQEPMSDQGRRGGGTMGMP